MDYLVDDCDLLRGDVARAVVELGCGLGLAGLVAAACLGTAPGSRVVLTDRDASVVARAAASARAAAAANPQMAPVAAAAHAWGESTNALGGPFDLVVAAEVLYDPAVAAAAAAGLAHSADALLARRGAGGAAPAVVVAFERRSVALDVLTDAFAKRGFAWRVPAGYYEDVFEERTEDASMFWQRAVVVFVRGEAAAADAPGRADAAEGAVR